MSKGRAYLDHNASMPLRDAARAAMIDVLNQPGNPSSVHAEGRAIRQKVEEARRAVAALVGGEAARTVFTSGATEAASMVLTPDWTMGRAPLRFSRLYVGATEHPCMLAGGRFPSDAVVRVPVLASGLVDLPALSAMLGEHDHSQGLPLVAMQWANNETGVIQPIAEIATAVHAGRGVLVVDAVQAAGRVAIDMATAGADCLILSAHKIGGPKGVGALVSNSDVMMPRPLVTGGGQERGHRAGTENVAGIVGFGAAAAEALGEIGQMDALAARRVELEAAIVSLIPDAIIHGAGVERLPNTVFFTIPGMKAETAQIAFDLAGVALSAGSACSSGKVGPSHVLAAMGHEGEGALRVSFGLSTQASEMEQFLAALADLARRRAGRQAA